MTEDDFSARPVQPLTEVDIDDPIVAGLGRAIDPPSRPRQALSVLGRALASLGRWGPESWVTLFIVAGCVLFTFMQLSPPDVLSTSTPAGGDMGAHVWGPAFMRDHLLPSFRLIGWTPDWYAGFPAYHFYMVIPSLAIALLSFILPYGLAFKLVAISGLLTLPIACWAFARLTRLPFPAPPLFAVAATAFLFDRSFSIYGGNIASTMAGEFSFSISLSLAVLFLGVVGRGLETGRHRFAAALLLGLTGLCHAIPLFFAVAGAVVWFLLSFVRGRGFTLRLWWMVCIGGVGMALTAWWILPFYLRSAYMNDMGWEKKTDYFDQLFQRHTLDPQLVNSPPIQWTLVLAFLGVVMSIAWKRRAGAFLIGTAIVAAAAFILVPQGRLWNARLLPFWFLMLYLLAALGVAELGRTIASLTSRDPDRPRQSVMIVTAVLAAVVGITSLAMPLRAMPEKIGLGPVQIELGGMRSDGRYHWLFLSTKDSSFVPSWARWNFTGYEGKPAYPEYHDIVQTMEDLGQSNGCGRAMWEHEAQHDRYGTPMALMLLPFWTDGCIGSMEGLYFEASSTTPYHFLNQDELSYDASNPQRDLPYVPGPPDQTQFNLGIDHLQMLGVKYYMAISEQMIAFAQKNSDLKQVAVSGPWVVFEVGNAQLVEPLGNNPAVLTDVPPHDWLGAVTPWYLDSTAWNVWPASGGPDSWQRIREGETPTATATTPVAVTNTVTGTDTISFDVTRPGTPVVVKVSYFPNWEVSGAEGPWRVGPNLMVVVPTQTHVSLTYGTTSVEYGSWAITLGGLVALVFLFRAAPLPMPEPRRWFASWSGETSADDDGEVDESDESDASDESDENGGDGLGSDDVSSPVDSDSAAEKVTKRSSVKKSKKPKADDDPIERFFSDL